MDLHAVFFDAGGTLIHPKPSYGAVYERATKEFGMRIPAKLFDEEMRRAWSSLDVGLRTSPDIEYKRWEELTRKVHEALPADLPFDAWFRSVYRAFSESDAWEPAPGAVETLRALKSMGIATGIISNWDERLHGVLHGLGLMHDLDHVIVAPWVGWRKPSAEIFRAACAAAHVAPGEALHVGDSGSEDVAGARAAGLQARLYDPADATALRHLLHLLHSAPLLGQTVRSPGE